jgi:hypothetical protein
MAKEKNKKSKSKEEKLIDDMDKKGKGKKGDKFSAKGYEPKSFSVLPAGEYKVELIKAIPTATKNGSGEYIKCRFKVVGGEGKGRLVFHNFNIVNNNELAVEIGTNELKQFMHCADVLELPSIRNLSPLLNVPVSVKVGIKEGDDKYNDQNIIKGFIVPEEAADEKPKKKKKKEAEPEEDAEPEKKKKKDKKKKKKDKKKDKKAWD